MRLGMIGLGRMGASMTERLLRGGHQVVGYDRNPEAVAAAAGKGAATAGSVEELARALEPPRVVWMMVPAGDAVDATIGELEPHLEGGDVLVDGGNSHYRDTRLRAVQLERRGVFLVDVGTSGGIWGLEQGYSMTVGGPLEAVERLRPALETLAPAPDRGWGHVGPVGAGHFVKMVHNGIEYGVMEAYAEGFALLQRKGEFALDLRQVGEIWRWGSVIRSWLLDLICRALEEDPELEGIAPWVEDSGEGRWTVFEAVDLDLSAPVITLALLRRLRSREESPFADRLLAAMRQQFGGHPVRRR